MTPAVAVTAAVVRDNGVPPELARLATTYAKAEARRARTKDADDEDAAEHAEAAMISSMRSHGVKACAVNGRLFVDAWTSGCFTGGAIFALSDVRGL